MQKEDASWRLSSMRRRTSLLSAAKGSEIEVSGKEGRRWQNAYFGNFPFDSRRSEGLDDDVPRLENAISAKRRSLVTASPRTR